VASNELMKWTSRDVILLINCLHYQMKEESVGDYFNNVPWAASCGIRWRLEVSIEISTTALSKENEASPSCLQCLQANSEIVH
jgi:hypothetical protein